MTFISRWFGGDLGGTARRSPLRLEPLEPRLLLDAADWVGTWHAVGAEFAADENWGDAYFRASRGNHSVTITDLHDGTVRAEVDSGDVVILEDNGDELYSSTTGYDDGDYFESYISMVLVDPNVAIFFYGEAGYDSDATNDLYWGEAYCAMATRGDVAITPRPWAGDYAEEGLELDADDWDLNFGHDYGAGLTVVDNGNGTFTTVPDGDVLTEKKGALVGEGSGYDAGDYYEEKLWVIRGPNDTAFYFGAEAGFDSADQNWLTWFVPYAGVCRPEPGSEYKPDLVIDGFVEDELPAMTVQGGTFTVPVVVGNEGNAPADCTADINVYLFGDIDPIGTLTGERLRLDPAETDRFDVPVTIPGDAGLASYYLEAEVLPNPFIAELDDTNNDDVSDAMVEVAEPQRDLTGTFDAIDLDDTVIPGDKGRATLTIANDGNIAATGAIRVDFYASTDETVDVGTDALLVSLVDLPIDLAANGTLTRTVAFEVPADLAPGDYFLLADIDSLDAIVEEAEDNNVASSGDTTAVAWRFGTFDGRKRVKLSLLDDAGNQVVFSLSGPGWGTVQGGATFDVVGTWETTASSSLKITTRGGARTSIGTLHADAPLRAVVARTTNVRDDLTFDSLVKSIFFADVADEHAITLNGDGGPVGPKDTVTMRFECVADTSIDTGGLPIKAFTAVEFLDTDATDDMIVAPYASKLSITGRKANAKKGLDARDGDFEGFIAALGFDAKGNAVKKMTVAGTFRNARINALGAVGSLSAARWEGSELNLASVGSLQVKGNRKTGLVGDVVGGTIDLIDTDARGNSLKKAAVAGTITGLGCGMFGHLASFTCGAWLTGSLDAWSVGTLAAKGNAKAGLAGDLGAAVTLTGQDAKGYGLGKLDVRGTLADTLVAIDHDAKDVRVAAWGDSATLAVGVDPGDDGYFTGGDETGTGATLLKLRIGAYANAGPAACGIIADAFGRSLSVAGQRLSEDALPYTDGQFRVVVV